MFVSQSSHFLALVGVFLDVGIRGGVPAPLMAFALLLRKHLLFRDHAAGRKPECHLRLVVAISRNANSTRSGYG